MFVLQTVKESKDSFIYIFPFSNFIFGLLKILDISYFCHSSKDYAFLGAAHLSNQQTPSTAFLSSVQHLVFSSSLDATASLAPTLMRRSVSQSVGWLVTNAFKLVISMDYAVLSVAYLSNQKMATTAFLSFVPHLIFSFFLKILSKHSTSFSCLHSSKNYGTFKFWGS